MTKFSIPTDLSKFCFVSIGTATFFLWFSLLYHFLITLVCFYQAWEHFCWCLLLLWGKNPNSNIPLSSPFCYHQYWPPWASRLVYVYTSLLVQYLLPTIIVVISYTMIYRKIKTSDKRVTSNNQHTAQRKMNRRKRTNFILAATSIVFFVSWAPLNILNVIINTENPFKVNQIYYLY